MAEWRNDRGNLGSDNHDIEREWLSQTMAGTMKIECRKIKPYWTTRFSKVSLPFGLRLSNGMNPPVPEVTVLITKDRRAGEYRLHVKKILGLSTGTSGGRGQGVRQRDV